MAEITLQKYLSRQEGLLKQGRYDEAIAHCRHILTQYPRSAATHAILAQALAGAGQFDEARKSFERVLAVYPDDANAYVGLARIAQQERRYDDALALFSRAYDLAPSNGAIVKELRELYTQRHNDPNTRLPQGIYTAAKQQVNAELYHRAIETLEHAIAKQETRYDLRVLLIEVLLISGDSLAAGKAALELLKLMPDCAAANRVMAQIWLEQKRPSDAQRYVAALEMVNPYAAFELVQGGAVPQNAFLIEELDYERQAKRELVNLEPDWLGSLGGNTDEDLGLDELPTFDEEANRLEADLDWMNEIDQVQPITQMPTRSVKLPREMNVEALSSVFDDQPDEPSFEDGLPSTPKPSSSGFTGLLSVLEEDSTPLDDAKLDDMLADASPLPSSGTGLTGLLSGLTEEASQETDITNAIPDDIFANAPADGDSADPLAWLYDEGIELLNADEQQANQDDDPFGALGVQETISDPHADDPLAWLKGEGIELLDTQQQPAQDDDPFGALGFQEAISDPHADNPFAWLKDEGISFDDSAEITPAAESEVPLFGAASLKHDTSPELDNEEDSWQDEEIDLFGALDDEDDAEALTEEESDPLAWMREQDIEMIDDEDLEDSLDWMKDPEDFNRSSAVSSASENVGNALDLFADLEPSKDDGEEIMGSDFDWNNLPEDDSQDDSLEWLSADDSALDAIGNTSANEPLFSEEPAQPESVSQFDGALNWLEDNTEDDENLDDSFSLDDSEPVEADLPDWLVSMRVEESEEEVEEAEKPLFSAEDDTDLAPESTPVSNWFALDSDDEELLNLNEETLFDEQSSAYTVDGSDIETEEDASMPDWLSAVGTTAQDSAASILGDDDALDDDDTFSLFDAEEEEQDDILFEDAEPVEDAVMPDWLSAVGTTAPESAAAVLDDDELLDDDTFSLFDAEEEEQDDVLFEDSEPVEAAVMPDWLSAMQTTSEDAEEEDVLADVQRYTYFENDAEPVDDTAIPDWLSTAENAAVDVGESVVEQQPDWLGSIGTTPTDEEDSFEVDDAQPDWMNEALIGDEALPFDEALDSDADEQDILEEAPSWLGASAQITDDALFSQFEEDADLLDADEFEITEEVALTPAENAPDFLNAMVPGLDVDITDQEADEPFETEFLEDAEEVKQQTDYAWVAAIVDDELRPPKTLPSITTETPSVNIPRRRFEFAAPPAWLRKLRAQKAAPDQSNDTLPDWLDFDDDTN